MKVAVLGLWHLGCVTAACLAKVGHEVIAYDPDKHIIHSLEQGQAPIFEPGLDELLTNGINNNHLRYSSLPASISESDIIWITFDTPVNEDDTADIESVFEQVLICAPYFKANALILISSQLPLGSTKRLENKLSRSDLIYAYIPENLRLGKAIPIFLHPDRIVVGLNHYSHQKIIRDFLEPLSHHLIWMSIASAEMTKHAVNAFLATSVVFINELATLCELTGANAYEVERGLKSEERIGNKAYLHPGNAIAGGTLLRDIHYLTGLAESNHHTLPILSAVVQSNQKHKTWLQDKLNSVLINLENKTVALLGLTYKPHTNTLRRSTAIETSKWLHAKGAHIHAYDPMIQTLPEELSGYINLKNSIQEVLHQADVCVVGTEWPEFKTDQINDWIITMHQPIIIDPSNFLSSVINQNNHFTYHAIGKST